MNQIIIILLGSHLPYILFNRIETAFDYIEKFYYDHDYIVHDHIDHIVHIDYVNLNRNLDHNNITWFLSGGIKQTDTDTDTNINFEKSEADIMKFHIAHRFDTNMKFNSINDSVRTEWNYILDKKSTNTAENFIQASKYLNSSDINYDRIYVVTSKFHYERAKKMLYLIDSSRNYNWILENLKFDELEHFEYLELLHSNNIFNDIAKAKKKLL